MCDSFCGGSRATDSGSEEDLRRGCSEFRLRMRVEKGKVQDARQWNVHKRATTVT